MMRSGGSQQVRRGFIFTHGVMMPCLCCCFLDANRFNRSKVSENDNQMLVLRSTEIGRMSNDRNLQELAVAGHA